MRRFCSILYAATVALVVSAAEPQSLSTLPQATAAHFCQLLVYDNTGNVQSLNSYIRQNQGDGLFDSVQDQESVPMNPAQLFCSYIFNYGGWQSLRIFPHANNNGTITWHAADERLPNDIDSEHQKYIHDVFPRLIAEIEAENWSQVDAYIDRMLKYQTTFASVQTHQTTPHTALLFLPFVLFLALPLISVKYTIFHAQKGKMIW